MHTRYGHVGCAIILALSVGCHIFPQPATTRTAEPLTCGQLVIYTDFVLPESHRLIQAVVAERDDVCRTLDLPKTDEAIHVHLFLESDRYAQFVRQHYPEVPERRAFFLETDTRLEVYAHWSDRVAEDLRHEVAHGYLHAAVPNLPLWLDEGLAEYFEVPRGHDGLNRPHVELRISHHVLECQSKAHHEEVNVGCTNAAWVGGVARCLLHAAESRAVVEWK